MENQDTSIFQVIIEEMKHNELSVNVLFCFAEPAPSLSSFDEK